MTMRRWTRLLAMAAHFALTSVVAVGLARRCRPRRQQEIARRFAAQTLRILGIRSQASGALPADAPALLVANHVSWLDVYLVNALLRARFVAKADVKQWPLAGPMVASFGTFFLVRGSFRDAARVKDRVAEALRAGHRVVVFPEATTSDGSTVLRFHNALFQAAIDARVAVQPVALHYTNGDRQPTSAAAFVGDMTFAESLHRVCGTPILNAELRFGPVLATHGRSRRELASASRNWIRAALGMPYDETQTACFKIAA